MKSFLFPLLLLTNVSMASDGGVWLRSNDEGYDVARLSQNLMATFVDQGFKQKEISKGIFELTLKDVRCDYISRDVLYPDYSNAGLPSVKCYVNAEQNMGGKGQRIQEGRYLNELFNTIQDKKDFPIVDCAMGGKCMAFVSSIQCWIDLNQEEMHNSYSCYLK